MASAPVDVSIVLTMHNASMWLEEMLGSVLSQTFARSLELSVCDDASTDSSLDILKAWLPRFKSKHIKMVIYSYTGCEPKGVGYGRNQAIMQSSGRYLCFCDADDVMTSQRIDMQYEAALSNKDALIGSGFTRCPGGSTERYTRWCNTLSHTQLYTQAFTAFGPTVIQPTWFCSREVYNKAGPFSEDGKGYPEDLIFFYKHLSLGGKLVRMDIPLIMYRYHKSSATFGIDRRIIWKLRVDAIQDFVLCKWKSFTIWNAGKQGRRLYRSLREEHRSKVVAFCDVDQKKLSQGYYTYEESQALPKPRVPIIHFSAATPPILVCVKWDFTGGGFEANLASLNLKEGEDYYHFS